MTVAFLTGSTFRMHRSLDVGAGVIPGLEGDGGTACCAGVTWNAGRLPGHPPPQSAGR